MPKLNDLTGKVFGRLTVIRREVKSNASGAYWRCQCSCGNEAVVSRGNLLNGSTRSCSCLRNVSNGLSGKHPLRKRWSLMVARCTQPSSPDYKDYGAKGIRVCGRWLSFPKFLEDMEATFFEGATLERVEVEGNYEPTNVIWATTKRQSRNKRNTVYVITPEWGRIPAIEAAENLGIPKRFRRLFVVRISRGWSIQRASTTKLLHRFSPKLLA